MKIGVISDTHIPVRAKKLPAALPEIFTGVDLILHAGDLVDRMVLDELAQIAPVEAVAGNMDPAGLVERLGRKRLIRAGDFLIGLVHGDEGNPRVKTPQRALAAFTKTQVDAIVFGHSHQPFNERVGSILLFNPGSPTNRRREKFFSCGILTLGKEIEAQIILF
jgi:hypothetical protein